MVAPAGAEEMKTAVAVSGGADSLYALLALKEAGHDLLALHGLFTPRSAHGGKDPLPALQALCARLGVPLHVADLRREFEERVIAPFVAAYAAGQTPNPCVRCNAAIKFGALFDAAERLGAERLATGHYARLEEHPRYGLTLRSAVDASRDQSYFLCLTPKERLERALFPLGCVHKTELRKRLAERGFEPPLPEESREICFVPGDDYRAFLAARPERLPGPGPARLTDGREIGRHGGLWRYTEGQRRGLGIAWSEPLYVLEKNPEENSLILGRAEELLTLNCLAGEVNPLVPPKLWPERVFARTRYRRPAAPAQVEPGDGELRIRFHDAQPRPAPGQAAAIYDEEGFVPAGGVIR